MKYLLLVLATIGCSTIAVGAGQPYYPKIFIEYASSLDLQLCPNGIANPVLLEAKEKVGGLKSIWNSYEMALLGTTISIVGKSFLRHEETVSVMVCPNLKGQAEPILIPIWQYLSTTTNGHPFDTRFFVGVTFHELLHRYIDSVLGGTNPSTPLLVKYSKENLLVRRHLHVDALQKAVYLRLGRVAEINAIIQNDSKSFGPDYARAWYIVSQVEGFESFVRELQ